ncbi:MAG: hypothetical protein AAF667_06555 [Pseudomonadota bacterium]
MQDTENFRAIVAESDLLRERWLTLSSQIIAECADQFGETVDRESLMMLNSVRLSVLTGETFDWRAEAQQQLPALKRASELADIKRRVEAEDAAAIAELDDLPPSERLSKAHAMGLGQHEAPAQLSDEEKMTEALRINSMRLSGVQRLAEARKAGLTY